MNVDRIRTERDVTAMAALDSFPLIADRVRRLLSHGRRMSMTQRYTYVDEPPRLYAGLRTDTTARGDGIVDGGDPDGRFFQVLLTPGLEGFGFAAYASDGNTTEEQAWKRYHDKYAVSERFEERRRNMTEVSLSGGREQDGPMRDDAIVIRAWNSDGVCDERVVAFEGAA